MVKLLVAVRALLLHAEVLFAGLEPALPVENGIVVFGTAPYREELAERTFKLAYAYFKKALDVRRSGSAALDLCTVAAGRAALFFELFLSPWDFAAGALIVEEAGGLCRRADGEALCFSAEKSSIVAAASERVFKEYLRETEELR
jgi:fructose-1,6-bisphosphatase/inositol monophosphatase family enzyme